jgi:hypothetical protein
MKRGMTQAQHEYNFVYIILLLQFVDAILPVNRDTQPPQTVTPNKVQVSATIQIFSHDTNFQLQHQSPATTSNPELQDQLFPISSHPHPLQTLVYPLPSPHAVDDTILHTF